MTHPANKLANIKRRVNRAREKAFPHSTCPASRHVHLMAECLTTGNKQYAMLIEEPEHCALSMLSVLESLWKARLKLRKLQNELDETEER